jgi:hypothetical protein
MLLQLSACICDNTMLAIWVDLCTNGPKAPQFLVITKANFNDERLVINWLGAQVGLEFLESLEGIRWQLISFPGTIFFC